MKQQVMLDDDGQEVSQQYGALPFRLRDGLEILLITSRETQRWVIPKGWPMERKTPAGAAATEAWEEAGVKGEVSETSIGAYRYDKVLRKSEVLRCRVDVFPLRVLVQTIAWPESDQRTVRWTNPEDAAASVAEPELAQLIRDFAAGYKL
ncbi:NUDIX hydrolase [Caulobacter sp. NIBR2454]|uniref:NUDIX hydrolase n=1 Tax=Caulobacter sp. NIBR2454 TaxID=3015996 RepID=UPI0022B70654|nr:NUDIX hydrolase [Caulobacter sp. NIBR2454]